MNFRNWFIKSIRSDFLEGILNLRLMEAVSDILTDAPPCPQCGSKMALRTNRANGNQFYGCSRYPNCKGTMGYKAPVASQPSPAKPNQRIATMEPSFNKPTQPPAQAPMQSMARSWSYGKINKRGDQRFGFGKEIAFSKRPDGQWDILVLDTGKTAVVSREEAVGGGLLQSFRDENNKLYSTTNPSLQDLEQKLSGKSAPEEQSPVQTGEEPGDSKPTNKGGRPTAEEVRLPPEKMTEFNTAVQDRFLNSNENIMIDALAGTGKTTMLKHLSSFIKPGERWLYLVFNKKNQIESQNAFPAGVDVMTTHSFLGKLLKDNGKQVGGETSLPPAGQKWTKIRQVADQIIPTDWPESMHSYRNRKTGEMTSPFHWKGKWLATKIAEMSKAYAFNPADPQIDEHMMNLIQKCSFDMDLSSEKYTQDQDYTPDIIELSKKLLQLTLPHGLPKHMDQQFNMYRDQDDTLWYAALYADQMRWNTGYSVILLDEVQDFNECQLTMARKLHEAGSRVVGVGDPNQAMYLFRGADSQAFAKLKDVVGGGNPSPLPVNFRSGGNLIDWVTNNTHVKNLQAAPHLMGKGEVYAEGGTHPPLKYDEFLNTVLNEYSQGGKTKEPTAMICRSNAPLGHSALFFLKNNIEFQIIGKDLSQDLTDLIKKVTWQKPQDYAIDDLAETLGAYIEDLQGKWANKISKQKELEEITSYIDVLMSVLQHLGELGYREDPKGPVLRTGKDLINYLQKKLGGLDPDNIDDMAKLKAKDPRSFVTLTTAHKSKGLEWDRTFLMKPKEYAPDGKKVKNEEEAQQQRNAFYVAGTRARNTLMVSADDEP